MSDDVREALDRARTHLRQASLEGLEATRALVDAGLRSSGLSEASGGSMVAALVGNLEEMISGLRENGTISLPKALADPLATAIDAEIGRWEKRSKTDPDARPVLRAFLGLREVLWELGMREDAKTDSTTDKAKNPQPDRQSDPTHRPQRNRVQRFDVEG